MFITENEVINWIYSFGSRASDNLDHLHEILAKLNNPHKLFKTIHIAGTNGKGSTVSYIREAFMNAGYKVATFTSPYITCFGERMSINNQPMPEADLVKYANILNNSNYLSTNQYAAFDIITLISFLYFADATVDIAIYETGIGGRLDSTNVITPLATAITNVGHDHAEILGNSQLKRAIEKLGIVKESIPLFTTEEDPDLLAEFVKTCRERQANLHLALEDAQLISVNSKGVQFSCCGYSNLKISMYGEHQFKNASLAVCILEYLRKKCDFSDINPQEISNASWQGRFEHVQKSPPVILDGAHNLEGILALIKTLKEVYPQKKKKFLFSAIGTKDALTMIKLLSEIAIKIAFTKGVNPKSIDPIDLIKFYDGTGVVYDDYEFAIDSELKWLKADEVLVVCGSLYFISDARKYLLEK